MNVFPVKITLACALMFCAATEVLAQQDSVGTITVDSVRVQATRIAENDLRLPLSLTVLDVKNSQDARQQLSLQEYLSGVPGLFALNANNFAQDLRVSIRGFGARSAFGIRGIQILLDGIPQTTPDGQGQVDNLSLGMIEKIEIIRGPAAALYGNASGGVINIITRKNIAENSAQASVSAGSYNLQNYQAEVGLKIGDSRVVLRSSALSTDGYRAHNAYETYTHALNAAHNFSPRSQLNVQLAYTDSPLAQDPGGLTLAEADSARRQARARNLDFASGEAIRHLNSGARWNYAFDEARLNVYGFYAYRDFAGFLPFEFGGAVDLQRNHFGHGADITFKHALADARNTLQIGYELALQDDDRSRFVNNAGVRGDRTFEQTESFRSIGIYALNHFDLGRLLLRAGLRFDSDFIRVQDAFLSNGDDSGERTLHSLNPSLNANYVLNAHSAVFAGVSTNFETPALSELSANPSGSGGFNEDLEAQTALNIELGYRYEKQGASAELVVFYIRTRDDITPFEIEDFEGRTFFRNAGGSNRMGVELTYVQQVLEGLTVSNAINVSDFSYTAFETPRGNLDGKHLPGIPSLDASLSVNYFKPSGLSLNASARYVGSMYTNDANAVEIGEFITVNLRLAYALHLNNVTFTPFAGINNLFGAEYNDNVRINAFASRFYEPAPAANVYGGLRVAL